MWHNLFTVCLQIAALIRLYANDHLGHRSGDTSDKQADFSSLEEPGATLCTGCGPEERTENRGTTSETVQYLTVLMTSFCILASAQNADTDRQLWGAGSEAVTLVLKLFMSTCILFDSK